MDRNRGFDINALRQQFEDLIEDFFPAGGQRRPQGGRGGEQPLHLPVNLTETPDAVVLTAPLPGLQPEDIEISVRGQSLTLKAQMKNPPAERPNYVRREWSFGPYQRNLEIPFPIDAEHAAAKFKHGVVTITLPRIDTSRSRTIHLDHEGPEGPEEGFETPETVGTPETVSPAPEPSDIEEGVTIETGEEIPPETVATATAEPMAVQQQAEGAEQAEGTAEPAAEGGRQDRGQSFYMNPRGRDRGRRDRRGNRGDRGQGGQDAQGAQPAPAAPAPEPEPETSAVTSDFEQSVGEQVSSEAAGTPPGNEQPQAGATEAATPSGESAIPQPDTENAPEAAVANTTTASPETPDLGRQEGASTAEHEAPAPTELQPDATAASEPTDTHTDQTPAD